MHWVIGDIHGMYLPLVALLDAVDRRDPDARLLFCGDYVNRGPDSRRVIDVLLKLDDARFCRGNHDDAFDLLLSGSCFAANATVNGPVTTFEHFLRFGFDQTLHSYGVEDRQIAETKKAANTEAIVKLLRAVPQSHREFIHALPVVQSGPGFFVAHAKWDVAEPAGVPSFATQLARSSKLRHDVLWGRYTIDEIVANKNWGKVGLFGHTPVTTYGRSDPAVPLRGPSVVMLDTGAALNLDGRLTAWCVEETRYVQADRDGGVYP